jgi:hypothetical protein
MISDLLELKSKKKRTGTTAKYRSALLAGFYDFEECDQCRLDKQYADGAQTGMALRQVFLSIRGKTSDEEVRGMILDVLFPDDPEFVPVEVFERGRTWIEAVREWADPFVLGEAVEDHGGVAFALSLG